MKPDQVALDRSLADAYKIARRLSRCSDEGHQAALALVRALRQLGAKDGDA